MNGAWTLESSALYPVTESGRLCYCYSAEKFDLHPDSMGFPGGSGVKNSPANAGDVGSIPGSGRSPGGGNGNPLWYSCLRNPTDRGAWWTTVLGVTTEQQHTCTDSTAARAPLT